jgi:hypothetical protein
MFPYGYTNYKSMCVLMSISKSLSDLNHSARYILDILSNLQLDVYLSMKYKYFSLSMISLHVKITLHSSFAASLVLQDISSTREYKIRISAQPCNILCIIYRFLTTISTLNMHVIRVYFGSAAPRDSTTILMMR